MGVFHKKNPSHDSPVFLSQEYFMTSTPTKIALLLAVAVGTAAATTSQAQAADSEKCFGVAKVGKNDCQTPVSSCAGTNKKDNNPQAFILVPKGTCDKLAGGSTEMKK
jgi:uncharacterized membrane protein